MNKSIFKQLEDVIDTMTLPMSLAKGFASDIPPYPPFNVIKVSDNDIVLEMALSGFKQEDISVQTEDGKLIISAKKVDEEYTEYFHKGIGTRSFTKTFALRPDAKISRADYIDGILSVYVSYEVPEKKKPKEIPISNGKKDRTKINSYEPIHPNRG